MQIRINNAIDFCYRLFIKEGNISPVFRYPILIIGVAFIFLDFEIWDTGWVYYVGFIFALIGGYSARAAQLGIRPFERTPYPRGWLKSRRIEQRNGEDEEKK